jgi:hypothetical protein
MISLLICILLMVSSGNRKERLLSGLSHSYIYEIASKKHRRMPMLRNLTEVNDPL